MQSRSLDLLVAVAILTGGYFLTRPASPPTQAPNVPAPNVPNVPAPPPDPEPKKPRRPWAAPSGAAVAANFLGAKGLRDGLLCGGCLGAGRQSSVGEAEAQVDLLAMPKGLRPHNIASKGLGCCVFRSADYCGRYQNIPAVIGMPEWMKQKGIAGGGWPEKVSELVPKIAADRGLPTPVFVQESGKGTALLELAMKTGRPACITWQGNHMLNCVYWDGKQGAIVDNNDPHRVQWFNASTFLRKYNQGGGGWTLAFGAPPPPPPPTAGPLPPRQEEPGPAENRYRWERADTDPSQWKLMEAGRQVGIYGKGEFFWLKTEGASGPCEPPILPPDQQIGAGVASSWKRSPVTRFSVNGREATREEAFAALADDSQLPFLTVIGSKQDAELAKPVIAPYLTKYRVQLVEPSFWAVSPPWGFVTSGRPTVYIQSPCGKPLHRQDDAAGLDAALANFEGTRKPDPNYQPARDPDLRKPTGGLPGLPLPAPAMALGLAGLIVALLPRKEIATDDPA